MDSTDKRPIVTVTGAGKGQWCLVVYLQGKRFKQYDEFNSNTSVDYLKQVQKRFGKIVILLIERHLTVQRLQEDFLILIRIPSDWNIFLLVLLNSMQ